MLIMDSGLGGLSVVRALRAAQPELSLTYLADTAGFPYGSRSAEAITQRASALIARVIDSHAPGCIVLACNTLSTLCLDALRAQFDVPFVGTVPAVKVAATRAKRFTLLATPNTADSAYSKKLIADFAGDAVVDRYGAPKLAAMAEAHLLGSALDMNALQAEISPAFHDDDRGRTKAMVLGCTHYPLILDALKKAALWDVEWIDSSDAIARRALSVTDGAAPTDSTALVTSGDDIGRYEEVFAREGFATTQLLAYPLHVDSAA